MKFTKGPWEWNGSYRVCANVASDITVICDTANNKASRTEEACANARLIGAAPAMFAALRMIVDDPGLTASANDVIKDALRLAGWEEPE